MTPVFSFAFSLMSWENENKDQIMLFISLLPFLDTQPLSSQEILQETKKTLPRGKVIRRFRLMSTQDHTKWNQGTRGRMTISFIKT